MSSADTAKTASTRSSTNSDAAPRERILSSALDLFYRHGIHAVGVDAIAEAAATNKMTLYRHFDSKDLLVAERLQSPMANHTKQRRGGLILPASAGVTADVA